MTTVDRGTAESVPAGAREWVGLAVLALPALLASLELTVTHLALPAIGADLGASSTQLLWIVDVYAFLLAGSTITMGTLGDRIGRRGLLLAGAVAYGVGSVVAAYAQSAEVLIVTRAALGLAGATLMPSTLALTATMFRVPRQRAFAVSAIIASVSAGTAVGPLVGGWVLERFWWGAAFLLGVPVMVVLLVAGRVLLPEHRSPGAGRLDLASAVLSLVGVLTVVYGLKRVAADGLGWLSGAALAVGAVACALFVRRQRRLDDPLVDLRLFRDRGFTAALATLAIGIFVLWGNNYAVAQFLQLVEGLDPLRAGLWTAPSAAGVIAGSLLAPRLARRVRPELVIGAGLLLSAAGFLVLTRVDGLATVVTGSIVVSAGLGPLMALATDRVVGSAPPERAGAASALSSTAPQLGGALGIALLGSVVTAVYRHQMAGTVPPDVPVDVAASAEDNLAGATAAAHLVGENVLATARDAFTAGFRVSAAVASALAVGAAVLVTVLARRHAPPRTRR